MNITKICCINGDFVGGMFAAALAVNCPEIEVHVIDLKKDKIKNWNAESLPVLDQRFADTVMKCRGKNLFFTSDPNPIKMAEMIFICPEAAAAEDVAAMREEELKIIEEATCLIESTAESSKIIVEKSSIPVKTTELISSILQSNQRSFRTFAVISNPDFMTENSTIAEFLNPEVVLIGGGKGLQVAGAVETLISVYEHWVPRSKILTSDVWSMKLFNIAQSALLAQRVTNMNTLAEICELMNVDVIEVAEVIGKDSRIGVKDLEKWIGFRGENFFKSVHQLIYLAESLEVSEVSIFWRKVLEQRKYNTAVFVKKILEEFGYVKDRCMVILGFAFQENSALARDSSAVYICKVLLEDGAKLKICDPLVRPEVIQNELTYALRHSPAKNEVESSVQIFTDPYEAAAEAQAIILCTNRPEFLNLDFYRLFKEMMKPAYIFDGSRALPYKELQDIGFQVGTFGKVPEPRSFLQQPLITSG